MNKYFHDIILMAGIMSAVIFSGCSGKDAHDNGDESKPTVVVSISPLQYFAESIGGDKINVECVAPAGADPETFEPIPSQLREASEAVLLLTSGNLPFEQSLEKILAGKNSNMAVQNLSEGIDLIMGTHGDEEEVDPHIWSSLKNAHIMAETTYRRLAEVLPQHEEYFRHRLDSIEHRLDSIDTLVARRLNPISGRAFLVWHPSLSYFARDYNLRQISVGSEHKDHSAASLSRKLVYAREQNPVLFFSQKEFDSRQYSAVVAETGLQPVNVSIMDKDIVGTVEAVADSLCVHAGIK